MKPKKKKKRKPVNAQNKSTVVQQSSPTTEAAPTTETAPPDKHLVDCKIQNIIFPYNRYLDEHWWMLYRSSRLYFNNHLDCHILPCFCFIEFFTYFNSLSIKKWKTYTNIESYYLKLRIKGDFHFRFFGHYISGDRIEKEIFEKQTFNIPEIQEIIIPIPDCKSSVIAFSMESFSEVQIFGGSYMGKIDRAQLNPIELAISTTTFMKEDFIIPNMELLNEEILNCNEEIADHIVVNIVDNGRTLDPLKYNSEKLHIYPNPNTGGAGGFTRGMIEAFNLKKRPTHVLLMDDDVILLPESIKRTYNMLRLVKEEYKQHFISGAMLFYEQMNVQHEDVGYVSKEIGSYGPRKARMEMHLWDSVVKNEENYDNKDHPYAGWWYCCIPMDSVIKEDNLPLPMFIRGDDVEYSLRNNAKFITLNGICIWHMGFTVKYNAALELYLVHRNSLMIQAISGILADVDFIRRIKSFFWKEIRRFHYSAAGLLLDAIEDYMAGPEFLEKPEGERILKEHIAKNEIMLPITEFPGFEERTEDVYTETPLSKWKSFVYKITFNGHLYPKFMLAKKPAVISYDWFDSPGKQYLHKFVLAVNPHNQTAAMRYLSRKKFVQLIKRYTKLMGRYNRENAKIISRYRAYREKFTSKAFWMQYLGLHR